VTCDLEAHARQQLVVWDVAHSLTPVGLSTTTTTTRETTCRVHMPHSVSRLRFRERRTRQLRPRKRTLLAPRNRPRHRRAPAKLYEYARDGHSDIVFGTKTGSSLQVLGVALVALVAKELSDVARARERLVRRRRIRRLRPMAFENDHVIDGHLYEYGSATTTPTTSPSNRRTARRRLAFATATVTSVKGSGLQAAVAAGARARVGREGTVR